MYKLTKHLCSLCDNTNILQFKFYKRIYSVLLNIAQSRNKGVRNQISFLHFNAF